jgi:hypothetical protein
MADQEEFRNLMVDPAEISHQSSGWETLKCASKVPVSAKMSVLDGPKNFEESKSAMTGEERSAANVEIIEFVLVSMDVRDPSIPIPPPSRFQRKSRN